MVACLTDGGYCQLTLCVYIAVSGEQSPQLGILQPCVSDSLVLTNLHSSYQICFEKLNRELLRHPYSHTFGLRNVCVGLLILRDLKIGSGLRLIHSQASDWCNGT
jgi:hypothetical protein